MPSLSSLLFSQIIAYAPFQPATALWRAVELAFVIEKAAPLLKKAVHFLDLGCGDGKIMRVMRPFLSRETTIIGIDIDAEEIRRAESLGIYERVVCSDAGRMDVTSGSQDAVFSNSVLEHVEDIDSVLAESARVLKTGGTFIATVPGPDFHACLSGPRFGPREDYLARMDSRLAHRRYWSCDQWRERLRAVGIDLTSCEGYLDRRQTRRWETLSRLTGGLAHAVAGKRVKPLRVQQMFGFGDKRKIPAWLAAFLARILVFEQDKPQRGPYSCLLLIGRKKEGAPL